MPKKPSPNLIKKHRVYTVWEAADSLGVHRQTVIRWIGNAGLLADKSRRPWLIEGNHLKSFLQERRQKDRVKLQAGEFYCLPCRSTNFPAGQIADFHMNSATTGVLIGICLSCDRIVHRFVNPSELETFRAVLDVTVQRTVVGIVSANTAPQIVTNEEAQQAHG